MGRSRLKPWRLLALAVIVAALALALAACGSSSGSSSTGSASETAEGGAPSASVEAEAREEAEAEEEAEGEEGEGSFEEELENVILLQIYGKFGGNAHEYHLVEGGTCKIVKINASPAALKADPKAILNHEKNASVEVAPLKGATMVHCREAAKSAIG
jgi:hypothetical protein